MTVNQDFSLICWRSIFILLEQINLTCKWFEVTANKNHTIFSGRARDAGKLKNRGIFWLPRIRKECAAEFKTLADYVIPRNKFYWHCQGHMLSLSTHLFVKSIFFVTLHFVWFRINQSFLKRNEKLSMLTCQILQHCLSQQLRRNWTSHDIKKQSENYFTVKEQPLQIYITLNSCKMESWWDVYGNRNKQ